MNTNCVYKLILPTHPQMLPRPVISLAACIHKHLLPSLQVYNSFMDVAQSPTLSKPVYTFSKTDMSIIFQVASGYQQDSLFF